ncbi:chromosomal replication initiator protein DnaA [Candidatus Dependentiae bacterium]|nr:chromosomal replication initiator protein DnaA [Candidatus Dependentiae bacterium]
MVVAHVWDQLLTIIRQEAGSRVVDTWLKAVTFTAWDGINKVAYLSAPNSFVKDWICTKYLDLVTMHLQRLLGVDSVTISIVTVDGQQQDAHAADGAPQAAQPFATKNPNAKYPDTKHLDAKHINAQHITVNGSSLAEQSVAMLTPARRADAGVPSATVKRATLQAQYQFSSFVVGPHNSLAFAAAQAVSNKPGLVYNPLLIYGASGLGKTHLLHAIGNHVKMNIAGSTVLYQTADRFVSEFISAIRFDRVHAFKERYKQIDVLLLDDIQFISNKDQTQEVFFHIFNLLYESRKQIVCTSDTYPRDMEGLAQRLRSRLEGGLIIDVHPPSVETKIAILQKKLQLSQETVPIVVLEYLASLSIANVRELEGALMRVMAFGCLTGNQVTLELAQRVLQEHHTAPTVHGVSAETVLTAVARYYGLTAAQLRSKGRDKQLVHARHITMYLLKKMTSNSTTDIAQVLNRADHTTVLHGIAKVQQSLMVDNSLQSVIQTITRQLQSSSVR